MFACSSPWTRSYIKYPLEMLRQWFRGLLVHFFNISHRSISPLPHNKLDQQCCHDSELEARSSWNIFFSERGFECKRSMVDVIHIFHTNSRWVNFPGTQRKDSLCSFLCVSGTACWPVWFQYPTVMHRKGDHLAAHGKDEDGPDRQNQGVL